LTLKISLAFFYQFIQHYGRKCPCLEMSVTKYLSMRIIKHCIGIIVSIVLSAYRIFIRQLAESNINWVSKAFQHSNKCKSLYHKHRHFLLNSTLVEIHQLLCF